MPAPVRQLLHAAMALALSSGPAAAAGQEGLTLGDELALLAEEDVVVTASRHAQRIGASPSSITVLTREDIVASGVTELHDLLRLVPGFDVFTFTDVQPVIGARAGTTEAGNLMVVLVDGREVALDSANVNFTTVLAIGVDDVERIEVIRGPGSSLYGANAYQGVVSIMTRKAPERWTAAAHVRGGGLGLGYLSGWAGGPVGDWRLRLSAGGDRRDPLSPDLLPRQVLRGRAVAERDLGGDGLLTVEAGGSFATGSAYTGLGMLGMHGYSNPYALASWRRGPFEVRLWASRFSLEFDADLGLNFLEADGTATEIGRFHHFDGADHTRIEATTADLSAQYHLQGRLFGLQHHLVTGGNARVSVTGTNATVTDCPEPFAGVAACSNGTYLEENLGLYGQEELLLGKVATLTAGVRLDLNTVINAPLSVSPRLAAVWHVAEGHDVRVGYGRAFRKPTALEARAHFAVDGTHPSSDLAARLEEIFATQIGNPDLDTEKIDALEVGYRGALLEGVLVLGLDLWAYRFSDMVYFRTDLLGTGFGGVPTVKEDAQVLFVNSDNVQDALGLEATVEVRPRPWLRLGAAYAYRHSEALWAFMPAHRVDAWTFLGRPTGPRLFAHADYTGAYEAGVRDPRSSLAPLLVQDLGDRLRLTVTAGWRVELGKGRWVEAGGGADDLGAGSELLGGLPVREFAGCPDSTCPGEFPGYGGQPLAPGVFGYVRGAL